MRDVEIYWANSSIRLLDTRDRYTRSAILEDFGRDPEVEKVPFEEDGFVTPVCNRRYSVIWRFDKERRYVLVRAVVPSLNLETVPLNKRKERVDLAIDRESKGAVAS